MSMCLADLRGHMMLDVVVGNIISAEHDPAATEVMMSKRLTSVFLDVLLLSGSDLAHTDAEVATVVSLAERDQSIVGLGIVGLDVSELGWVSDRFAEHKEFLLRIIDIAMAGLALRDPLLLRGRRADYAPIVPSACGTRSTSTI